MLTITKKFKMNSLHDLVLHILLDVLHKDTFLSNSKQAKTKCFSSYKTEVELSDGTFFVDLSDSFVFLRYLGRYIQNKTLILYLDIQWIATKRIH